MSKMQLGCSARVLTLYSNNMYKFICTISEESKEKTSEPGTRNPLLKGRPFCEFYWTGEGEEHVQLIPRKAGWSSLHRAWEFWLISQRVADTEVDVRTAVALS